MAGSSCPRVNPLTCALLLPREGCRTELACYPRESVNRAALGRMEWLEFASMLAARSASYSHSCRPGASSPALTNRPRSEATDHRSYHRRYRNVDRGHRPLRLLRVVLLEREPMYALHVNRTSRRQLPAMSRRYATRLAIIAERLNICYRQVLDKRAPSSPTAIALDAAEELLPIMFDLDHRRFAAVAIHGNSIGRASLPPSPANLPH